MRDWHGSAKQRRDDAGSLLPAIWICVPLLAFCLAQSRMPLYLSPLFVPLAVVVAMQRQREGRGLPDWRFIATWAVLLLKLASAFWPTHKNAQGWADAIRERASGALVDGIRFEIVFVEDMARYGLHLHLDLGTGIERIALDASAQPRFDPGYDETLARELAENEPQAIWICKQARWLELQTRIAALGYRPVALEAPYQGRILFRILPAT